MTEPRRESAYTIRRKGSLYNIYGPEGRAFTRYKSASVAGPRWEELTHTPWPYHGTAYQPGLRLWQLGLIEREQVGQTELPPAPVPKPPERKPRRPRSRPVILMAMPLALPAPTIDLNEQAQRIQALRRDPTLLFDPQSRQALRNEVEYHLPQARWAGHLLKLLARYDARQKKRRRRRKTALVDQNTVLEKHIAWQEQRFRASV